MNKLMKSMIVIIVTVVTFSFITITIAAAEENQDDRTLSPYFFIEDGDFSVDNHLPSPWRMMTRTTLKVRPASIFAQNRMPL